MLFRSEQCLWMDPEQAKVYPLNAASTEALHDATTYKDMVANTMVNRASDTLKQIADVPVVLIQALRQADGRYVFHAEDIAVTHSGDRERDVDDIVRRFSEALERLVRRHPGQYFWQHRRWKHQPPDTPPHLREP